MEHKFQARGAPFTIGVEEELMILDADSLELVNAIESMLESAPVGEIKPELMESVLEVSTDPCKNTGEAGDQLRALCAQVREIAARKNMTIGSAGTHPFAMWEDQRIVARPRYRDLVSALRFVARQELIFGMHVHLAVDDLRDGRGPGDGLADPRRAHARTSGARPGPGPRAVRALRRRQDAVALSVRDAGREQMAGGAARPRGRPRRPAALGPG